MFKEIRAKTLAKEYNKTLSRLIPSFVYRKIEKLFHLPEINEYMRDHNEEVARTFLKGAIKRLSLKGNFLNDIPLENRSIIVANHPIGGPESILLMDYLLNRFQKINVVMQPAMLHLKPMREIGVDKQDFKNLLRIADEDYPFLIFPAGACSRYSKDGRLFDLEWKNSFVKLAKKHDRKIIPAFISGSCGKKFFNLEKWRKRFFIKTTIEAIYLIDQLFIQEDVVNFNFAQEVIDPKDYKEYSSSKISDAIRNYVYLLGSDINKSFNIDEEISAPIKF